MLAGDFTAVDVAAVQRRPADHAAGAFVNNRIDPALFSPAAMNLARRLPSTTHPCGEITYELPSDSDEFQTLARIDFQSGARHSFFGRYLLTRFTQEPGYQGGDDNVLKTFAKGSNMNSHSTTLGATTVFSASVVNSLRFAANNGTSGHFQHALLRPADARHQDVHRTTRGTWLSNCHSADSRSSARIRASNSFFNDTYQIGRRPDPGARQSSVRRRRQSCSTSRPTTRPRREPTATGSSTGGPRVSVSPICSSAA